MPQIYAGAHAATLADPINTIRSPLIKSGLMMYLHTVAGGAAWGLGSSLYHGTPVLSAVARTALVTGLVPAFFVGGIVSLFQRYQRDANTEHEVFRLYSATMFATVWPALYIMPAVDRYAPLWLGGHVVGFGSFFVYMLLTDADLMKNDHALEQEAPPPSPFEDMRARLRKARLEARVKRDLELEIEREEKEKAKAKASASADRGGSAPL